MGGVMLVGTGGTIGSRIDRQRGYVESSASGAELVGLLHEPPAGIEIAVDEFCNVGSIRRRSGRGEGACPAFGPAWCRADAQAAGRRCRALRGMRRKPSLGRN